MADLLQSICTYMVSSGELSDLAIGDTLCYGTIPQNGPDLCSVVMENVGMEVDADLRTARQVRLQILTRGPSYYEARTEALRIFDWLVELQGVQLSGWWLYHVVGTGPANIGKDGLGREEFSSNSTLFLRKE